MSNSPWGSIDHSTQIEPGVRWVSTPSHGGLMITRRAAENKLSAKAIEVAFPGATPGYVCFEEDCSYAVAFYEQPQWKRMLDADSLADWKRSSYALDSYMGKAALESMPRLESEIAKSDEQIKSDMAEIVRHWNPEYFGEPEKPNPLTKSAAIFNFSGYEPALFNK